MKSRQGLESQLSGYLRFSMLQRLRGETQSCSPRASQVPILVDLVWEFLTSMGLEFSAKMFQSEAQFVYEPSKNNETVRRHFESLVPPGLIRSSPAASLLETLLLGLREQKNRLFLETPTQTENSFFRETSVLYKDLNPLGPLYKEPYIGYREQNILRPPKMEQNILDPQIKEQDNQGAFKRDPTGLNVDRNPLSPRGQIESAHFLGRAELAAWRRGEAARFEEKTAGLKRNFEVREAGAKAAEAALRAEVRRLEAAVLQESALRTAEVERVKSELRAEYLTRLPVPSYPESRVEIGTKPVLPEGDVKTIEARKKLEELRENVDVRLERLESESRRLEEAKKSLAQLAAQNGKTLEAENSRARLEAEDLRRGLAGARDEIEATRNENERLRLRLEEKKSEKCLAELEGRTNPAGIHQALAVLSKNEAFRKLTLSQI